MVRNTYGHNISNVKSTHLVKAGDSASRGKDKVNLWLRELAPNKAEPCRHSDLQIVRE